MDFGERLLNMCSLCIHSWSGVDIHTMFFRGIDMPAVRGVRECQRITKIYSRPTLPPVCRSFIYDLYSIVAEVLSRSMLLPVHIDVETMIVLQLSLYSVLNILVN